MVENNGKIETQIPITDKDSQEIIIDIVMEGKSAYDLAVERGYEGTIDDWLNSLVKQSEFTQHKLDYEDLEEEISTARGTELTLGARLDSTDAQLNNMTQDFTQHKLDYVAHKEDYNTLESEFTQHKLDYAEQANVSIENTIDFKDWTGRNSLYVVTDLSDRIRCENIGSFDRFNYFINRERLYDVGNKVYFNINYELFYNQVEQTSYKYIGFGSSLSASITNNQMSEHIKHNFKGIIQMQETDTLGIYWRPNTTTGVGHFIDLYKDSMIVDLTTSFGAGNEPNQNEMDLLIKQLPSGWFDGEITFTQKQIMNWQLSLIRQNRNAIIALGGTII